MSKKKVGIIIVAAVVVVIAVAAGLWFFLSPGNTSNGDKVYVQKVSELSGMDIGTQNRYSGVVEPQKSMEIKKNPEKTVKEVFVHEGDIVEAGMPLFEYESDTVKDQIAQAELEMERIDNEIADYYAQIKTLEDERTKVSEDEKFQYTTQIQSIQTSIKQSEYSKESKRVEIENLQKTMGNSIINCEMAGVVKSISENGYDPYTGQELPFMTILAVGDYRVKGTINEQNIWTIQPGSSVLIRSRVDENQIWMGTITEIDTNNQEQNNNYYDGGPSDTATKYPFYIGLDSAEGLLLGQHVYIEMDMGQAEVKEGIWLYESYIVMDGEKTYVWADDGNNKLEKRAVELGEYDVNLCAYQILSGLTEEDYLAYPMMALYEGVATVKNQDEVDYSSPLYMEENGDMSNEDMLDEGMLDQGIMDEGVLEEGFTPEEVPAPINEDDVGEWEVAE